MSVSGTSPESAFLSAADFLNWGFPLRVAASTSSTRPPFPALLHPCLNLSLSRTALHTYHRQIHPGQSSPASRHSRSKMAKGGAGEGVYSATYSGVSRAFCKSSTSSLFSIHHTLYHRANPLRGICSVLSAMSHALERIRLLLLVLYWSTDIRPPLDTSMGVSVRRRLEGACNATPS